MSELVYLFLTIQNACGKMSQLVAYCTIKIDPLGLPY